MRDVKTMNGNPMTKELTVKQYSAVPSTDLSGYIATAYAMPVLGADEERALAIRYRDNNDLEAAHKLVTHNLRFVIQVARGYAGYGLSFGDLIQEGNIGLMKAVKKFDSAFGVRLVSFAVYWIRAEMHEFILKNWRIVKVATTKAQRKLFFNLRSMKKRFGWLNQSEVKEIAAQLGVKPEEVIEMEQRLSGQDISFSPVSDNEEEDIYAPEGYLVDQLVANPADKTESKDWQMYLYKQLNQALAELDKRSLEILKARWMKDKKSTLHELAEKYQISAERVRQIESQAIAKLKDLIGHSKAETSSPRLK